MSVSFRGAAANIDVITGSQRRELEVVHRYLAGLLEKHPALDQDNRFMAALRMTSTGGSIAKTVNDLRYLAQLIYADHPLEDNVPECFYCEREKRPIKLSLESMHKEHCFMCDGRPEGIHGTRQVTEYLLRVPNRNV